MSDIVQAKENPTGGLTQAAMIDATMSMFERVLRDDTIPTERFREIMAEVRLREEQIAERDYFEALARARNNFGAITQNRTVDFTNKSNQRTHYKFEDLQEIERAIRQPLADEGISYTWRTEQVEGGQVRVTCIMRRGIHKEETTLQAPRDDSGNKNPIQQVGSTVTFLQRYTLKSAAGLAVAHDDDANGPQAQDAGPITAGQYVALVSLIEQSETDLSKLLKWAKIRELAELPQGRYRAARKMMFDKMGKPDPEAEQS